ncbi:MAG: hypothetical protein E7403_00230 [Ruminococcaceae bacterium]|nr:hypothetical protein [Oscillospiraceae bacterium]
MDSFLDSVKQAMDTAVKQTGKMVEKTKIKIASSDTKNTLKTYYMRLGELTYRAARGNEELSEEIEQALVAIDQLRTTLAKQEEMATGLSEKKYCPHCGVACTSDSAFCPGCGKAF